MNATDRERADIECMARMAAGEDLALNDIMQRWQQPLVTYLYRSTGSESEAVDLAQETFVRVYEKRHSYRPSGKFSTWLFTIATNLARNHARWRKRHPTVSLDAENDDGTLSYPEAHADRTSADTDPASRLIATERALEVQNAILDLPEKLRTPLLLAEYDDLPHAEIGRIVGASAKAVELRIYRAKSALRKALSGMA